MGPSFHLDAPAKVNLGLRIRGRRADGYHLIESLFAPLDLADTVALRVEEADAPEVSLQVEGGEISVPTGPENLVWRAARAFLEAAELAARVEIGLVKRTPAAAGLGGGSSDAAAVLRGLVRAFPDALEPAALEALGLSLGADVPFFLNPEPAWVTGVGEQREAARDLPALSLLLANPGQALPTTEVYRAWDALERPASPPCPRPPDLAEAARDPDALGRLLHNDLEGRRPAPVPGGGPRAPGAAGRRGPGGRALGERRHLLRSVSRRAVRRASRRARGRCPREAGCGSHPPGNGDNLGRSLGLPWWGVAKLVRQRPLEPPFVGSSPTAPASGAAAAALRCQPRPAHESPQALHGQRQSRPGRRGGEAPGHRRGQGPRGHLQRR